MKITPLEIKQKTFEKAFRGYEKQDVQAFLVSLAKEWEKLQTELKDLKSKCEHSQQEVAKLREVEESLFKTLKTAEDTRTNLIEQASKAAELHLKETQIKTEGLLNGAKSRAKDILEKAENKAMTIIESGQNEIRKLQKSYATIEQHREQLISSLRILSQDLLQKLKRMENMPQTSMIASLEERLMQAKRLRGNNSLEAHQVFEPLEAPSLGTSSQQAQPPQKKAVTSMATRSPSEDKKSFFDELK